MTSFATSPTDLLSGGLDSGSQAPGTDTPPPSSSSPTPGDGTQTGGPVAPGTSDPNTSYTPPSDFSLGNLGTTMSNSLGLSPQQLAGIAQAYQQYSNSKQYPQLAEKYTTQLDPFGSQRAQYQQLLAKAQSDPAAYISSLPSYQAALQLGLGATNRGAMSKTGAVSNADDIAYASNLADQTWNQEMNRIGGLAGANIGPQAAAGMLQTGLQGQMQSQNSALAALFNALFPQGNNTGAPTPGGGTKAPTTPGVTGPGSPTYTNNTPAGVPNYGQGPGTFGDNTGGAGSIGDTINQGSPITAGNGWTQDANGNWTYDPGLDPTAMYTGGDGNVYNLVDQIGG